MINSGYKLVCIEGETKGDEVILSAEKMPTAIRFLRAASDWSLASAANEIDYTPDQPVFVEYFAAMAQMLDECIFKAKYQARSRWSLVEIDEEWI